MKIDRKTVKHAVERTNDLVKELGENATLIYPTVFKRVLDEEIMDEKGRLAVPDHQPIPKVLLKDEKQKSKVGFDWIINSNFDWSKFSYVHRFEPYVQYLLILKIAYEEFGVDGLTAPEIQKILIEKLRIAKSYNTISMALASFRGKYVDRIQKGSGFVYRISKLGLDRIQESYDELVKRGELEKV